MRYEVEGTVHNIGICLACGATKHQTKLDRDHFFPRSMLTQPTIEGLTNKNHPLREVVINRSNLFVLCRIDHEELELKKQSAFGGPGYKQVDPEGLIDFLKNEYPITQNTKYFDSQIKCMIRTTKRFIETAANLNGELPKDLKRRYQKAAADATIFVKDLEKIKEEGLPNVASELIFIPKQYTIVNITHP